MTKLLSVFNLMIMSLMMATFVKGKPYVERSSGSRFVKSGSATKMLKKRKPMAISSSSSSAMNTVLLIERGGGVVDPLVVGKVAAGAAFVQGVLNKLCPDAMMEMYGFKKDEVKRDPLMKIIISRLGAIFTSIGVMGYFLLDTSSPSIDDITKKAVGVVQAIFAVEMATGLINDEPTKGMYDAKPQQLLALMAAIVAYSCLSKASWSIKAIQVFCVGVLGLVSLFMAVLPKMASTKFYGDERMDIPDEYFFLLKGFGYWLLSLVTMIALLVSKGTPSGMDLNRIYLLGWIPIYIFNVDAMLISQNINTLGLDKMKWLGWLLLQTILVASLLL